MMNCLNTSEPLATCDLDEIESFAHKANDSLESRAVLRLVGEVRRLNHEAADPRFLYAGCRIQRGAIICRDAEVDRLREELRNAQRTQG